MLFIHQLPLLTHTGKQNQTRRYRGAIEAPFLLEYRISCSRIRLCGRSYELHLLANRE